ncbi:hypothetical protein NEF87_001856 [Candidatus Lokiarchaeum ossiferum]|uniref:HTH tetR-type domain-containing protein n=1 Tax=Candidatus Lokiarchaeum ossiferum TaxID=2951803 RepID=A0ABY6HSP3_9ARCH|nr:hypothetical protein NEF87_001856 [Candidatus Lokiarchaeum sp. B-35]
MKNLITYQSNVPLYRLNIWKMIVMPQNKKEQILIAAGECFAKFGYKKTTLGDIGKIVGFDKTSIYHYFKSKEEIFTTLVLNEFQEFITKLHEKIEEDMVCEKKILVYFEEKLNFWMKKAILLPQITEIEPEKLQHLMSSGLATFYKIEQDERLFVANLLKGCIQKNQIQECDVEKMSDFMFVLADGIKENYMGMDKNKSISSKEYENVLKDVRTGLEIFLRGLK